MGKSHLTQANGAKAIRADFLVIYRSVFDLVREFLTEQIEAGVGRLPTCYLKPNLHIIDIMGSKIAAPRKTQIRSLLLRPKSA